MKLTDILTHDCVLTGMEVHDKTQMITALIDALAAAGRISDREIVLKAVLAREKTLSTGIGQGLAVPHGKCTGCSELVMAMGKPATPLDFDSKDGKPVYIVVLLVSPTDRTGPHIQALARVSRLMLTESFREAIAAADSPDALWDAIVTHDEK